MLPKLPRLESFDYVGSYRYFLTFCTAHREPAFCRAEAVQLVLTQILRAAKEHGFEIIAYCFMPDHVHLLVQGAGSNSEMKRFAKVAKQYAGFHYKQQNGKPLWQPSYYEHVLRNDEDTWSVARYIVDNPLRAGLAERADEYPFLGSCVVEKSDLLFFVSSATPWRRP